MNATLHRTGLWFVMMLLSVVYAAAAEPGWTELKVRHFRVYYTGADEAFAAQVAATAETDYARIATDLGFRRSDDFWLWEKRINLYIYSTREQFLRATHAPEWAEGQAVYSRREIASYQGCSSFINAVLPHELAHLILRDFIGFGNDIPLWLNEGIAQREETLGDDSMQRLTCALFVQSRLIPLVRLSAMTLAEVDASKRTMDFYAQSATLVSYLIDTHGRDEFRQLCGHIKDRKSFDDALKFTYPAALRSITELEEAWKEHLGNVVHTRRRGNTSE
jgi:hypothetical protein